MKPWQKQEWCIPTVGAAFVARMEDVHYTVNVIPFGGTTVVDTEDITITAVERPDGSFAGDSVFVALSIP